MRRLRLKWNRAAAGLLTAALLTTPVLADTIGGARVNTNNSGLNLRAAASKDAKRLAVVPNGTFLLVEETLNGWYKVAYNGMTGYVSADYVEFSETMDGNYGFGATTAGTEVNLRSGAATGAGIVKNLPTLGVGLQITGVSGNWVRVTDANGDDGYIRSDLVEYTERVVGMDGGDPADVTLTEPGVPGAETPEAGVAGALPNGAAIGALAENAIPAGKAAADQALAENAVAAGVKGNLSALLPGLTVAGGVTEADAAESKKAEENAARAGASSEAAEVGSAEETAAKDKKPGDPSLKLAEPTTLGEEIIATAVQYLGTPYSWGGMSPETGFDCSGFVNYIFNTKYGYSLERVAHSIYVTNGVSVSRENWQPGDLLFFGYGGYVTHVGIYAGDVDGSGRHLMIHSSTPQSGGVILSDLDTQYYLSTYMGAKRVIS